jgi:hypothetical protein
MSKSASICFTCPLYIPGTHGSVDEDKATCMNVLGEPSENKKVCKHKPVTEAEARSWVPDPLLNSEFVPRRDGKIEGIHLTYEEQFIKEADGNVAVLLKSHTCNGDYHLSAEGYPHKGGVNHTSLDVDKLLHTMGYSNDHRLRPVVPGAPDEWFTLKQFHYDVEVVKEYLAKKSELKLQLRVQIDQSHQFYLDRQSLLGMVARYCDIPAFQAIVTEIKARETHAEELEYRLENELEAM